MQQLIGMEGVTLKEYSYYWYINNYWEMLMEHSVDIPWIFFSIVLKIKGED